MLMQNFGVGGGGGANKVRYGKFGNGVSLQKKERLSPDPRIIYTSFETEA